MPIDRKDTDRIRQLRAKRLQAAQDNQNDEKRSKYGEDIVAKINLSLNVNKSLSDYNPATNMPFEFRSEPNFEDCSGLVAAHTSEENVRRILTCVGDTLGPSQGMLGFDEYAFIGVVQIKPLRFESLLDAAKSIHSTVLCCAEDEQGIVVVDHYNVAGVIEDTHFSLIVQGEYLEREVAKCFGLR